MCPSSATEVNQNRFRLLRGGIETVMELPLLLIVIGIIVALLVSSALGLALILIGVVLLIWPRLRTSRTSV